MENIGKLLLATGKALYDEGRTVKAIDCFRESIKLDPENGESHIHLAYALCRIGDYDNGFKELAWVWRPVFGDQSGLLDRMHQLEGKTILISADAGLGDSIMFSRFLKDLKSRDCRIVLQVQDSLTRLFSISNLADFIIANGYKPPPFDLHIPFHSLMAALNIGNSLSSVGNDAYLSCDEGEFIYYKGILKNKDRRKVGLCWQGNPDFVNDKLRSISLEKILEWTCPNDYLISLVPNNSGNDSGGLLSFEFSDIAETAALIKNLDIVYTVDTMICHLSGALGIPTVLLNRFNGCWRWGEGDERSVWYKSVKIVHQRQFRDWVK